MTPFPARVALFTDRPAFAGTERHILDLACALRTVDVSAEIVCPPGAILAERAARENVPVFVLPCGGKARALPSVWLLRQAVRAGRWQVLHTHNGTTTLLGALALAGGNGRASLVATQHFIHPARTARRGPSAAVGNAVHRLVERRVRRIVAVSEAVQEAALARDPALAGKTRVVLNGIRDPASAPLTDPAAVRRRLGVAPEVPLIVCLSRLDSEKNLEILVAAMRIVTAELPAARCLIAGTGAQEADLTRQIHAAGLENNVRLLGFQEDALSLVRAADLFVLPSTLEPFGLSLVEAMALGVPVVAMHAGGPREIVVDGESGRLTTPGDAGALAAAAGEILRSPPLAARLAAGGRERFLHRFTAARMAADTCAVYQECLFEENPR